MSCQLRIRHANIIQQSTTSHIYKIKTVLFTVSKIIKLRSCCYSLLLFEFTAICRTQRKDKRNATREQTVQPT